MPVSIPTYEWHTINRFGNFNSCRYVSPVQNLWLQTIRSRCHGNLALCSRSVNFRRDALCATNVWPQFLLSRGLLDQTSAATFLLYARAARTCYSWVGVFALLFCSPPERLTAFKATSGRSMQHNELNAVIASYVCSSSKSKTLNLSKLSLAR